MAAALVESMEALTLREAEEVQGAEPLIPIRFKVSGLPAFELELAATTAVRDVKKFAKEACGIEPEHMRFIYRDTELKDADTLECYKVDDKAPVCIMYTAGHTEMLGGSVRQRADRDPYSLPARGLKGSKGQRVSRVSGRLGGMALIRKYGLLMKRQEFREKAEQIGFRKYR